MSRVQENFDKKTVEVKNVFGEVVKSFPWKHLTFAGTARDEAERWDRENDPDELTVTVCTGGVEIVSKDRLVKVIPFGRSRDQTLVEAGMQVQRYRDGEFA